MARAGAGDRVDDPAGLGQPGGIADHKGTAAPIDVGARQRLHDDFGPDAGSVAHGDGKTGISCPLSVTSLPGRRKARKALVLRAFSDMPAAARDQVFQKARQHPFGHRKVQHNGMMVGSTLFQHFRRVAGQAARHAAVQPERYDIAGAMGAAARSDIAKARQRNGAHGIEIADDRRRPFQHFGDMQQLPAIEKLAMAEMDIGEMNAAEFHQLRQAGRHATRYDRSPAGATPGSDRRVRDCQAARP